MKNYWQNAVTFDEYIKETERRIEVQNPEDDHNEYYELGLQRMNRTLKTFKIDEEQLTNLEIVARKIASKYLKPIIEEQLKDDPDFWPDKDDYDPRDDYDPFN